MRLNYVPISITVQKQLDGSGFGGVVKNDGTTVGVRHLVLLLGAC